MPLIFLFIMFTVFLVILFWIGEVTPIFSALLLISFFLIEGICFLFAGRLMGDSPYYPTSDMIESAGWILIIIGIIMSIYYLLSFLP